MKIPLATTVFLVGALCAACCEDTRRVEQRSPSGEWLALVTVSNCGALADYGTIVSLRRTRHWFRGQDQLVISVEGRHDITVVWRDDHTLLVTLPTSSVPRDFADRKVDVKKDEVAGVHIIYEQT